LDRETLPHGEPPDEPVELRDDLGAPVQVQERVDPFLGGHESQVIEPGDLGGREVEVGELKLKELRAYATKELGPKFDIREFHDQVLDNGAVPLDILETRIKAWVKDVKEKGTKSGLTS